MISLNKYLEHIDIKNRYNYLLNTNEEYLNICKKVLKILFLIYDKSISNIDNLLEYIFTHDISIINLSNKNIIIKNINYSYYLIDYIYDICNI